MRMFNVSIIIPVYYNEEDVAKLLMKLTQLNYNNIHPHLYIAITGCRDSFSDTFLDDYIKRYNKQSESIVPLFESISVLTETTLFNPSPLINSLISESDSSTDYICIIEPSTGVSDNDILQKFIQIDRDYDYKSLLGAVCSDAKQHKISNDNLIRWHVDEISIVRTMDGNGFNNGCLFIPFAVWKKFGGFSSREYTHEFTIRCHRNNHIAVYAEGIR